jgi:hypothetical protein
VRVEDEDVWLRAEAMEELFQKDRRTVQEHLKNIFNSGELDENSVCRKFRHTAEDGKNYNVNFYSLEAIIAVGYRADSQRAIEFCKLAAVVLSNFAKIQEIRASERKFYQKITDIYATAVDYDAKSRTTKDFFAAVQNKKKIWG